VSDISKAQVIWEGFPGGPGVNTFYFVGVPPLNELRAWYAAHLPSIPADVTLRIPNFGQVYDSANGNLQALGWSGDAQADLQGGDNGKYAAPVGVQVRWHTDQVFNNRRLVGKTFIVPFASGAFDTSGKINVGTQTNIQAASTTFLADTGTALVVWHRPVGGLNGGAFPVLGSSVSRNACVLRSRRD
jgi:hypothetical protein